MKNEIDKLLYNIKVIHKRQISENILVFVGQEFNYTQYLQLIIYDKETKQHIKMRLKIWRKLFKFMKDKSMLEVRRLGIFEKLFSTPSQAEIKERRYDKKEQERLKKLEAINKEKILNKKKIVNKLIDLPDEELNILLLKREENLKMMKELEESTDVDRIQQIYEKLRK